MKIQPILFYTVPITVDTLKNAVHENGHIHKAAPCS